MVAWHVTPDYIVTHWTDELLDLMVEKLVERKERETPNADTPRGEPLGKHAVSPESLAAMSNDMIKMVKVKSKHD